MPRLNARGDVAAGIGNSAVSINRKVIAEHAGLGGWPDDDHLIYAAARDAREWQIRQYDVRFGAWDVLDPDRGANTLRADGGVWAAWLGGHGVRDNLGRHWPAAGLMDVGDDGTIIMTADYQSGAVLDLAPPGGDVVSIPGGPWLDLRAVRGSGLIAIRDGRVWTWGIAEGHPDTLTGFTLRGPTAVRTSEGLILLVHYGDQLVAQRWHRDRQGVLRGRPIGPRDRTYNPDAVWLPALERVRVAWAETQGEAPVTVQWLNLPLNGLEEVLDASDQALPAPPAPTPTPEPSPPEEPMSESVALALEILNFRDHDPDHGTERRLLTAIGPHELVELVSLPHGTAVKVGEKYLSVQPSGLLEGRPVTTPGQPGPWELFDRHGPRLVEKPKNGLTRPPVTFVIVDPR